MMNAITKARFLKNQIHFHIQQVIMKHITETAKKVLKHNYT